MKNTRLAKRLINTIQCACVFISGFKAMAQEADSIGKSGQVNKLFECTTNKSFPGESVQRKSMLLSVLIQKFSIVIQVNING
jgi:hypothetical protein